MRHLALALHFLALAAGAGAIGVTIAYIAAPDAIVFGVALNSLLFAMIALGLVLIAVSIGRTADPVLRRALLVFLLLTVVFSR